MIEKSGTKNYTLNRKASCHFFNFGLIVTGETEEIHLPKLFNSLPKIGICNFSVIRRIGQRSPIISKLRKLKMVGEGKTIPNKDESEIGLPARKYITTNKCRFVLLVDDLEHDRRDIAQQIFDRYRLALDSILYKDQKQKVAVHFLVPMLEAYYFADAKSINSVLKSPNSLVDYDGDVESKRNPKAELKKLYPGFDEKEAGGKILDSIDLEHVLSRPDTCASLRTLIKWCVIILERYASFSALSLSDKFCLQQGKLYEVTKKQLE